MEFYTAGHVQANNIGSNVEEELLLVHALKVLPLM